MLATPLLGEQFAVLLGREESGENGVHSNVIAAPVSAGQELRDLIDAGLGDLRR